MGYGRAGNINEHEGDSLEVSKQSRLFGTLSPAAVQFVDFSLPNCKVSY